MARLFFGTLLMGICLILGGSGRDAHACGTCPNSPEISTPDPKGPSVELPVLKPLDLACGSCGHSGEVTAPSPKGSGEEPSSTKPLDLACGTCGHKDPVETPADPAKCFSVCDLNPSALMPIELACSGQCD